jgi:predicted nucleic acid-binding protein
VRILIFVDASIIIALINKRDNLHKNSLNLANYLENEEKVISNLVITEILNSLGKFLGGKAGKSLYDNFKDNYIIFNENRDIYDSSIYTYRKYDGTIGFADCVSIEIMKKLNIKEIASFDSDFDKIKEIKRKFK